MQRPGPRNRLLNRNPGNAKVSTEVSSWVNFTPLSLSPVAWYDAADTATIVESGGAVSQWNDKSGNGYNLVQGTSLNQPTTGSATINGLNVLSFDGTNDRMQNLSVPSTSTPHTYVVVAKETSGITSVKSLVNAGAAIGGMALFLSGTSPSRSVRVFIGDVVTGPNVVTTDVNIFYLLVSGDSNSQIGFNSTINIFSTGAYTRASGIRIGTDSGGTSQFFNGQIGEVLYLNRALTTNERFVLFSYLRNKWGPI